MQSKDSCDLESGLQFRRTSSLLLIWLALFFVPDPAQAQTVTSVQGSVLLESSSSKVEKGQKIALGALLVGEEAGSAIQLEIEGYRVSLKGNFKFRVLKPKERGTSSLELIYGKVRARSEAKRGNKTSLEVKTPVAVAAVRGTDFLVMHNLEFSESEIVTFESQVQFKTPERQILVGPGQWGGTGLRFGKMAGPVSLPPEVLKTLESLVQ